MESDRSAAVDRYGPLLSGSSIDRSHHRSAGEKPGLAFLHEYVIVPIVVKFHDPISVAQRIGYAVAFALRDKNFCKGIVWLFGVEGRCQSVAIDMPNQFFA